VNRKNTTTMSAIIEILSKKHFTSVGLSVKGWCMSPHGIMGPPEQTSRNSGNVSIGQMPNVTKFRRVPTKNVRDIRCGKILLPGKVVRIHPRSSDMSPINRPRTSFYYRYRYSVCRNFGSRLLRFRDIAGLYPKCHFCTYPLSFTQNLKMFP